MIWATVVQLPKLGKAFPDLDTPPSTQKSHRAKFRQVHGSGIESGRTGAKA